ncbi:hypothetical protein [Paucisalibacillus globulus]|uniref:hypothetical protein n=1 Tax=Paucisalibacillus globulus TaxID=351095 RepID=UPI00041092EF|nr:hypothetical protein [Paucisalibacillus globulus]
MKKLFFVIIAFVLFSIPTLASASSATDYYWNNDNVSAKKLEEIKAEVEHIFTKIIVKDESSNQYYVDDKALKNSTYNAEEKEVLVTFAQYLNSAKDGITTQGTLQRCLEDAAGIAKGALNQIAKAIEKGEWATVAGFMVAMGFAASPIAVFLFALFCGANPVSSTDVVDLKTA